MRLARTIGCTAVAGDCLLWRRAFLWEVCSASGDHDSPSDSLSRHTLGHCLNNDDIMACCHRTLDAISCRQCTLGDWVASFGLCPDWTLSGPLVDSCLDEVVVFGVQLRGRVSMGDQVDESFAAIRTARLDVLYLNRAASEKGNSYLLRQDLSARSSVLIVDKYTGAMSSVE